MVGLLLAMVGCAGPTPPFELREAGVVLPDGRLVEYPKDTSPRVQMRFPEPYEHRIVYFKVAPMMSAGGLFRVMQMFHARNVAHTMEEEHPMEPFSFREPDPEIVPRCWSLTYELATKRLLATPGAPGRLRDHQLPFRILPSGPSFWVGRDGEGCEHSPAQVVGLRQQYKERICPSLGVIVPPDSSWAELRHATKEIQPDVFAVEPIRSSLLAKDAAGCADSEPSRSLAKLPQRRPSK